METNFLSKFQVDTTSNNKVIDLWIPVENTSYFNYIKTDWKQFFLTNQLTESFWFLSFTETINKIIITRNLTHDLLITTRNFCSREMDILSLWGERESITLL